MKRIALLGFGTVGSGVYEIVEKNAQTIEKKIGTTLSIEKILVRHPKKYESLSFYEKFTSDFDEILKSQPDIVVEVMGGLDPSESYIRRCLEKSIHVVTANKDLIAEKGQALWNLAVKNNVTLLFEASVGGGIPILRPIQECLRGNEISSITAVINGTTNFILSQMYNSGLSYEEALSQAQIKGFAEADPSSDVLGLDAVRKLSILSALAYNQSFDWTAIPTEGIINISADDIACAKSLDSKIKLLAYSESINGDIYAFVRPAVVHRDNPIAQVDNEFNAVILKGDAVGTLMFSGKGAGKRPTASAVFGDILDIVQNRKEPLPMALKTQKNGEKLWPKPSKWMLRIEGTDKNILIQTLLDCFFNQEVRIQTTGNSNQLYAVVCTDSEKTLQKNKHCLEKHPAVEHVHSFLMYD